MIAVIADLGVTFFPVTDFIGFWDEGLLLRLLVVFGSGHSESSCSC